MPGEWSLIETIWDFIVSGGNVAILFLLVVAFIFEYIVPGTRVTKIEKQRDIAVAAAEERAKRMEEIAFETARVAGRNAQTAKSLVEAAKE